VGFSWPASVTRSRCFAAAATATVTWAAAACTVQGCSERGGDGQGGATRERVPPARAAEWGCRGGA